MAYSGIMLSSDVSSSRMINITSWRKDSYSEVTKTELGPYAGFLHGPWDSLECELSCAAIRLLVPIPTAYLQDEQDRIKQSLLLTLGLTAVTIMLPENSAHNANLNRSLMNFISDYKKVSRKLSSFLLSTIDAPLRDIITGLSDYADMIEHPIYVYHAILILVKVSADSKFFELSEIQRELLNLKPNVDENIDLYVGRYKKMLSLYLNFGGRDLMPDRAAHFILSLTSVTSWREVVQREHSGNARWYINWAAALQYTNETAFHTFVTAVQVKIRQSLQYQALIDRHNGVPAKVEKPTSKTALAATKEIPTSEDESPTEECGWCKLMNKRNASKHQISTCFTVQVLTQALKKKDSGVFTKVADILTSGGFPSFTRKGEILDVDEMPPRPTEGGKTGGGRQSQHRSSVHKPDSKTALMAIACQERPTFMNFFSSLADSDSDESHTAFPAIDYEKLKYNLSVVGVHTIRLIVDTGCTNHLFSDESLLWNVRQITPTTFKGMANVVITMMGESTFGETFFYPGMGFNLISWSQLRRDREMLDTKRSFSEDNEDSFLISVRGCTPLVFNLDEQLDLYVLDGSDDNFTSQHETTKAAFASKRVKKTATQNIASHPVVTQVVVPVGEISPEIGTATPTDTVTTSTEVVASTPHVVPGLGSATAQPFTPHARKRAEEARRLHCAVGHPSSYAMRLMLAHVMTNSDCSPADVTTADKLFGECIHCAKGKQTLVTTGGTYVLATEVGQVLHADIVYGRNGRDVITKKPTLASWLLTVDELTGYVLLVEVLTKTTEKLLEAIHRVVAYFQKYGHVVRKVMVDSESTLKSCSTNLGLRGVELLPRPPGEHEKHAENHTRTLRARMRAIESHLGYDLPDVLATYLAIAACMSYNLVPNNRTTLGAPHTYVTGTNVDAKLYGKLTFGQAVIIPPKEAHTTTNRDEPRATEGMFLGHLYGQPGSGYFLLFPSTSKANVQIRAIESTRAMIPTTTYVASVNALRPMGTVVPMSVDDELYRVMTAQDYAQYVAEARASNSKAHKGGGANKLSFADKLVQPTPEIMHVPPPKLDVPVGDDVTPTPSIVEPQTDIASDVDSPGTEDTDTPEVSEQVEEPRRASVRPNRGLNKKYGNLATLDSLSVFDQSPTALIASLSEELAKFGDAGEKALIKEAQQLLDLKVVAPTDIALDLGSMPKEDRIRLGILNCKAFLEEKRDGRIKARIVGGTGSSKQFREKYGEVDSQTVRTETVMVLLKVASQKLLKLAVLDVPGAFLHAAMKDLRKGSDPDTPRYVKLTGMLANVMVKLKPEWKIHMNHKGELVLELLKALYGLIEASRLWMDEITSTLIAAGFVQSLMDPCLYIHKEKNLLVAVYVDDFLFAYELQTHLDWLIDILTVKYGAPRVQAGDVIDYLNIRIRRIIEPTLGLPTGSYVIDQEEYASTMMDKYNITEQCNIPHGDDFFDVNENSPKLTAERSALYVSMCMSMLFTCNRVRVDVFLHTSFLCTRLKEPTEQDMSKLNQVFAYLNETKSFGMAFSSGDEDMRVFAWIDASYAIHADAKGHSGTVITIGSNSDVGGNVVYVKSRKQKLVGRSSTEAELIALHDGLPQVIWTRNLLEELGFTQSPAEVFQDNKSTIYMSENGRGNHNRSKHIAVRYFYAKGLIKDRIIKLTHLGTDEMIADAFTKVMSKSQFLKMRNALLTDLSGLATE